MKSGNYFKKSSIWIFWIIIALLAQFPERLALISKGRNHNYAIVFISAWLLWALFTPYILRLTARYPFDRDTILKSSIHQLGIVTLVVLLHTLLEIPIIYLLDLTFFQTPFENFKTIVLGYALFSLFIRIFICSFILSVGHGIAYFKKLKKTELEASQLQAQLSVAQLESLRTQLQPHFLFNVHQTLIGLMLTHENEKAIKMVTRLSSLLRKSLEKSENMISLKQELDFVKLYLEIQHVRFQDRLTFVMDIPKEVFDAKVPSFILQPLVENAIKHGLEPNSQPGLIQLKCERLDNKLKLQVIDNGSGLTGKLQEGVGLTNTKARLNQLFINDHHFSLSSGDGNTVACIQIPFTT